jgi:hypothetical protein
MWRDVLEQGIEDAVLLERIRDATRTGRPAGDAKFVGELESRSGRALRLQKRGPKIKVATAGSQFELGVL